MSKRNTTAPKSATVSLKVEATNNVELISELAGNALTMNCVGTSFMGIGDDNTKTNSVVPVIFTQTQFSDESLSEQVCVVNYNVVENGVAIAQDADGKWLNRSQKFQITAERLNSVTGETFKVRGTAFEAFKVIADAVKASGKLRALINGSWVAVGFKSYDLEGNPAYKYQEASEDDVYEGLDDVPTSRTTIPFNLFSVEHDGKSFVSVSPEAAARYATY